MHTAPSRMTFSPISRWCVNAAGCCPAIPLRSKHLPCSCPPLGKLATDIQLGTSLELLLHCHVPFLGQPTPKVWLNVTYKGSGPVPQPGSPRLGAAMGLAEAFLASALQFNLSSLHFIYTYTDIYANSIPVKLPIPDHPRVCSREGLSKDGRWEMHREEEVMAKPQLYHSPGASLSLTVPIPSLSSISIFIYPIHLMSIC